jgi:DNA-nicking Smr family endonuclease
MFSPMKGERGEDRELFEEAMADVERAKNDRRAPETPKPAIASTEDREREARREFERVASGDAPLDAPLESNGVDPAEYLEGKVTGLDPRVLAQLRRGEFSMQDEIDLHRLNSEDAHDRLDHFLADAQARGLRCVRVVHGWGRGSEGGVPVLKPNLGRWLERGSTGKRVLAYATERANPGATCILLRGGGRPPVESRRRQRGR